MPEDVPGRVLFVSAGPSIAAPTSGEGVRLRHLSQGLAKRGWDVYALVPDAVAEQADWIIDTYTYKQWSLPFLTDLNPYFGRSLASVYRAKEIDIVHLSHGVCVAKLLASMVGVDPAVIYAAQNVEADHAREFVAPSLPLHKRLLGPRIVPWIERATVLCADGVTAVSDHDRGVFIERYNIASDQVMTVPTGTSDVDPTDIESREQVRERLNIEESLVAVFHGTYDHPPNREAVDLIRNEIAPAVRDLDIGFVLVGKGMPSVATGNIHSVGFVDDLYSVLNIADLAVVPIRHGGGTKTKLYDYISLAIPIVATKSAVQGVGLVDGDHGRFCEGVDQQFVSALTTLAEDRDCRKVIQQNLRMFAAAHSWERSIDTLQDFYYQIG